MRAHAVRPAALAAVIGAAVGSLIAIVGNRWAQVYAPTRFAYFSVSSRPPAPFGFGTDWWRLLWPAALTGAVVGVLGVLVLTVRRHGVRRPLSGGVRGLLALGAVGAVLGLAVAAVVRAFARPVGDVGRPRRFVDYLPTDGGGAYRSTLAITFDQDPSYVWVFPGICVAVGVVAGVVVAAVTTVARRRGMSRETVGAA